MEARGASLPQWYLDKPEAGPLDDFYINCYWALNTTRRYQGGPIPWDVIVMYAREHGLDSYMSEVLVTVIRYMDSRLLDHEAKEADKARQSETRKVKRR